MSQGHSLNGDGSFIIKDYNRTSPFSNFLPGIAGAWGVPLWVFYVNRGQGVVSFGLKDKDHAILEFFPANKAYSFASSFGFRTLLKVTSAKGDGKTKFYEPFKLCCGTKGRESMIIKSASLEIKEANPDLGLNINIKYFTLPNTPVAGLVRKVTIENNGKFPLELEALDGLSRIIPFGAANFFLKKMSRTLEAWMQASISKNLAVFRLTVDPRDVSQTKYIEGANFNYSFYQDKGKIKPGYIIVDPRAVFSQDTSFSCPINFLKKSFKVPLSQIACGQTPCSFSFFKWKLDKGQSRTFYSVFGSAFKPRLIKGFTKGLSADFLDRKDAENEEIVEALKNNCLCVSGLNQFSQYVKSTYMDNVLRGGYPYRVNSSGSSKRVEDGKDLYYIYSRKHGDLERDYNQFQLLPSYFSEGQANYRDINQNRRMDLFFEPALGSKNITYFLNFLKIDGYNPLVIRGEKLYFSKARASTILKEFGIKDQKLLHLMIKGFYLGDFFKLLDEEKIKIGQKDELALKLLRRGEREPQAIHSEGYWIDHWHYNLDLIESFLYFYPDKIEELFLKEKFFFWDDEHCVKPRSSRYALRGGRIYQDESLEIDREKRAALRKREMPKNFLRTKNNKVYETNLICKLLTLILNKAATLDPEGIGIEMEADKPGWCDSLNGLPALFGSSLCETLELKRTASFLLKALKQLRGKTRDILVPVEVFSFFTGLNKLLNNFLSSALTDTSKLKNSDYLWWNKSNFLKESFRQKSRACLKGSEKKISLLRIEKFLNNLTAKLNIGIRKAKDQKTGLPLTYFTYSVKKYDIKNKQIMPRQFIKKSLPLFLEGVMHTLKVDGRKSLHSKLKKSVLFDKKLKMYRLNAPLNNESLEIGRSRIFTPGWLENESIWLHMEYKYLLELLKNGFYEEFFAAFYDCGVCFFNPKDYGRSPLENSSFIVSSAYIDKSLWGKGFVARLSGATAELLNIWILLCLGKKPFYLDKNKRLCLRFSPALKKEFFTKARVTIDFEGKKITLGPNIFAFKLFSKTLICYHNPQRKDILPKSSRVKKITVTNRKGKTSCFSSTIKFPCSLDLRNQKLQRIDVYWG